MQLACELAGAAFFPRNLGPAAVANHLGGTRFDVEVARRFSPDSPWPRWRDEATDLCRHLSLDSARGLRRILDFVLPGDGRVDPETQRAFVHELSADLRRTEAEVEGSAHRLAREMTAKVGAGRALTDVLPTSREELR